MLKLPKQAAFSRFFFQIVKKNTARLCKMGERAKMANNNA
ncbi:hypothetical protein B4125_1974 [Bacillus paralicheniformis]|uniref:Uncharacterized protein n=1 Tax=Bacillus paralicheniformis TaxID=1648923 RepID=A0ABY3FY08_9BACI|nr:hypothetical protein SC10_B2orf03632 [Bacillus paralicheniformis]OLG07793.1 hypothetical protein B4125_1974 [Bacillus paralicheniformis]TWJ80946.1 hypothetical protein CHCC4186_3897 [Bacillus paralicheniformis]TWL41104.1 hypothetical protein CHCC15381_1642 [Bacillus paralicheniformis]TWM01904.1 hypothetical protein CHCC15136_2208 [Bacillus paralicheniformis]